MRSFFLFPVLAVLTAACAAPSFNEASPPPASSQDIESRALELLGRMSLEEKVGQVIQADISAVTPAQAREYHLGSVLNGGNSAPGGGKTAEPEEWIALADAFWDASTDTSGGRTGIPLLWGTDAVHGHNNLQYATIFPHNSGLGAANDTGLMREIATVTAREVRATGLDWTFAPTLAVARDDRWGRAYESYSENPEIVARYALAFVEGLQGGAGEPGFLSGERVIATAKHFVADGGTTLGIDKGDAVGDVEEILAIHAAGYGPAIGAGVQTVMSSFSSINGEKMHGSRTYLTDILRGRFGFDGFVVGDWNGHGEVPGCTNTDCPQALMAGIDMYMAPDSWQELYYNLLSQVRSGVIPQARLDEAVLRILRVKIRSGLFEAGRPSSRESTRPERLGEAAHRDVARRAVRASLVLLKNEGAVLPLQPGRHVLVAGSGADSMEQQTGGWTLNWQGRGNANSEFVNGQTIFAGLSEAIEAAGGSATLSPDGSFSQRPDVAVIVFGEQPYAEYRGDRRDLVYEFADGENLSLMRRFRAQGIPVVAVFLTGRPLWVNAHLNAADAFVVGWLPGTEGGGIADVLVSDADGKVRHDFSGRLSFSWPVSGEGSPINEPSDPGILFPFGYGLTYADESAWEELSEEPGVAPPVFDGMLIRRGDGVMPFSVYVGDNSNGNIPVVDLAARSLAGIVTLKGIDYQAQEDAREVTWSGQGRGVFKVATDRPVDPGAWKPGTPLAIEISWNVIQAPQGAFSLAIGCGDGCAGRVRAENLMQAVEGNGWTRTIVPIACFVGNGWSSESLIEAFEFSTDTAATLAIESVSLQAAPSGHDCPAAPPQ